MAIACNYDYKGLTVPSAYIRVDHLFGGKRGGWGANIGIYASSEQQDPITQMGVNAAYVANESPLVTLYHALKELPAFAGAVDC